MSLVAFTSRATLGRVRVDRENGIIRGVSICSIGEARGHNKRVDARTLEQLRDCASQYGSGLKVRFNPSTFNHGDAGLAGYIPNDSYKIGDGKLTGDMHVYSSYPYRDYLFEMAETAPDHFGLSVEFGGEHEEKDGVTFARCEEIFAATVVDLPAANPTGLFSVGEDKKANEDMAMTDEQMTKLSTTIVEAVTKGIKTAFAETAGDKKDAPKAPSAEEEMAAGVVASDTPEQKKEKVDSYRANLNRPLSRGDFMQIFRTVGGRPARVSGDGEGIEGDGDKNTPFAKRVERYKNAGMSQGKAILRAKTDDRTGYNAWRAGQSTKQEK